MHLLAGARLVLPSLTQGWLYFKGWRLFEDIL